MNEGISVLHSYPTWLPQTQTWLHTIVSEQQWQGFSAHVVCERIENLEQFPVENLYSLSSASLFLKIWNKSLRKLRIRRHLGFLVKVGRQVSANIVHSHFGNVGWANLGAVRQLGAHHIVTFYGLDVNMLPQQQVWRERYLELFDQADLFLCEGPYMAECLKHLGCPPDKVRVQHLGIRVREIAFQPRRWNPGEPLRILIASTFREKKGIPFALEMVGRLQHLIPVEVTLIGGATTEPRSLREEELIRQTIASHSLEDKIRLLGFQPHSVLWAEAYQHHVFLSPSVTAKDGDTEGGAPVTIIEMTASGMPIISTTHCDIPEVMQPEAARFLSPERDPEALLNVVRRLISNWDSLGVPLRSLRTHIENEFDASKQGQRLIDHYLSIL
jgi:colanic acid/amylovoran biosynthesis glycosyltransferase